VSSGVNGGDLGTFGHDANVVQNLPLAIEHRARRNHDGFALRLRSGRKGSHQKKDAKNREQAWNILRGRHEHCSPVVVLHSIDERANRFWHISQSRGVLAAE
jgi:hypothetical protein